MLLTALMVKRLLEIEEIYNIAYTAIKKIGNYKNICSVNPLYLYVNCASGYIEEKCK